VVGVALLEAPVRSEIWRSRSSISATEEVTFER